MTTSHEAIFNAINGVHRDPHLSLTAANAVLDALEAVGMVIVPIGQRESPAVGGVLGVREGTEQGSELIPTGQAERGNWFRQLAHVVHLGRCTRFPYGDCHRHEESEYFTPKDNDIASVVIRWLEFDASVRAGLGVREGESE